MPLNLANRGEAVAYHVFGDRSFGPRIEFVFKDGRMRSLPYTHLVEVEFNPHGGIVMAFVGQTITIEGLNLRDLFHELSAESIGRVTEHHANQVGIGDDEAFVSKIEWRVV